MKKFCIHFFVTMLLLLLAIACFNAVIDPFYHYHAPVLGTEVYLYNQVYQTPGAAKHFEYDSAIVGSSMTENFHSSWFAEEDYETVKLSYSGARTRDLRTILDKVFESGNEIEWILIDINDYQLTANPNSRYGEQPEYLYNDILWDDTQYLFNGEVFWISCERVYEMITDTQPDPDDAYTWADPQLFSAERLKQENQWMMNELVSGEDVKEAETMEERYLLCEENLNNLIPVIEAHPETEFIFYFPPYSILYWERQMVSDRMWILDVDRYCAEVLLQYPNVRVYYFQDETEIISNLDNYRDECHHSPQINKYIFECIMNGQKELTEENVEEYFENMRQIIIQFPFETIWQEQIAKIGEEG